MSRRNGSLQIGLELIGVNELATKFQELSGTTQKSIVRSALRKSTKRVRNAVAQHAPVDTGNLRNALIRAKVRAGRSIRGSVAQVMPMPDRDALNIPSDEKGYYPYSIEYGYRHKFHGKDLGWHPPSPFIRPTVDGMRPAEIAMIGADIGRGIEKVFKMNVGRRLKTLALGRARRAARAKL